MKEFWLAAWLYHPLMNAFHETLAALDPNLTMREPLMCEGSNSWGLEPKVDTVEISADTPSATVRIVDLIFIILILLIFCLSS